MTESRLVPWYTSTVKGDRVRTAQIAETMRGRPLSPAQGPSGALAVAMMHDATLFRAGLEIASLLALPEEVFARPGMVDRMMKLADVHPLSSDRARHRAELVAMMA